MRALLTGLIALSLAHSAWALRWTTIGNKPVADGGWPQGALEVANLPSRIGWIGGDGGWSQFHYQTDEKGLQEALDLCAKIRAPELLLVIHSGREQSFGMTDREHPNADLHTDWSMTVYSPAEFYRWNSHMPTRGEAPLTVPSPKLDVYVGGGGIADFSKIKVPANLKVTDERADANGASGSVIRGEVFAALTSKPLPGATIVIERYSDTTPRKWESSAKATSSPDGRFEVKDVPAGSIRLIVSADGFAPRVVSGSEMRPNTIKQFTANLMPAMTIRGTIVDTDNMPLAGVTLEPRTTLGVDGLSYPVPENLLKVTSDERGQFSLTGLPEGSTQLRAARANFYQLDPFAVTASPRDAVTIRMTATGSIKGTVVDALGNPAVQDAVVRIQAQGDPVGKWGGSRPAGADGTFEFTNVPPGEYVVSTSPGPARAEDANVKTIVVKAGEATEVTVLQTARVRVLRPTTAPR